jgi:hypothetical protein
MAIKPVLTRRGNGGGAHNVTRSAVRAGFVHFWPLDDDFSTNPAGRSDYVTF